MSVDPKWQRFEPAGGDAASAAAIAEARQAIAAEKAALGSKIGEIAGEKIAAIAALADDATIDEIERREKLTERELGRLSAYDKTLAEKYPAAKRREELGRVEAPYARFAELTEKVRASVEGNYFRAAYATIIAVAEDDRKRLAAGMECIRATIGLELTPDEKAALPVIPDPYDTMPRGLAFANALNLPLLLPIDPQDERQMAYWDRAVDNGRGGTGQTMSAADLARQRAPLVIEGSRRLTEAEIEANRAAGLIKGTPYRQPGRIDHTSSRREPAWPLGGDE